MYLLFSRISVFFCLFGPILNLHIMNACHDRIYLALNTEEKNNSSDSIDICVKIIDQRSVNGSWHDIQLRTFSYNEANILTGYEIDKYVADLLVPEIKIFNILDRKGQLSEQTGQKWDSSFGGTWMDINGGCHIKYDGKGNRTEYIEYILEDGKEIINSVMKSKYDETGKEIRRKTLKGRDSIIVKDDSTEITLNEYGKIIEEISREWRNNEWIPTGKVTSLYDVRGRIIETKNFHWQTSEWVSKERRIYSYDENQKITEEIVQSILFGKFQDMIKNVTYLNSDGTIVEIQSQGYAPHTGWKTSMRTVFEYKKVPTTLPTIGKTHTLVSKQIHSVSDFKLSHNYPNPFNATTQIQYTVPHTAHVSLRVYDIIGREIANLVDETKEAGDYTVMWNGWNVASGVYFYQMVSEEYSETRKMNLIK